MEISWSENSIVGDLYHRIAVLGTCSNRQNPARVQNLFTGWGRDDLCKNTYDIKYRLGSIDYYRRTR